ncbi:hypothetical protein QQP08_016471 [Theobroma cacao]|nr:hypothetical protein QQP08_016471 [Theobroma cacao]
MAMPSAIVLYLGLFKNIDTQGKVTLEFLQIWKMMISCLIHTRITCYLVLHLRMEITCVLLLQQFLCFLGCQALAMEMLIYPQAQGKLPPDSFCRGFLSKYHKFPL